MLIDILPRPFNIHKNYVIIFVLLKMLLLNVPIRPEINMAIFCYLIFINKAWPSSQFILRKNNVNPKIK